ncbi:cell division protein ZipA C-terminal FtsZ-binding domain-containing protein [Nitrosomonas sp. Is37]|uniref:cell division protein ZipA C-terminal FtsZ-binding domain-containing protein n=1 Tax=Nitrosomonas sp. Is37 TaxID=3080535 RepID=UPI00294B51AF|nr:cell division protein ZipA C-terminal FtsZ-binding domain-containing protein [Nitrosomonas sp. Is37]MDV6345655.1 cell division protein ZipA C-terminal FtsZ-binding domain-containing protein [Nitrosomonas sp. Is37]
MSDLQISLIIIGATVIGGVVFFNWLQQARYRRNVKRSFEHEHEDALLKKMGKTVWENDRIEPKFGTEPLQEPYAESSSIKEQARFEPDNLPIDEPLVEQKSVNFDSTINYITSIRANKLITYDKLTELLQQKFDFGKPVHWFGLTQDGQTWEEITMESLNTKGGYIYLNGCLQLADRAGPASEINLSRFRDMVEDFASQVNAVADCPDISKAHIRAVSLDKFCAEVDVVMGINIISKDGGAFVGTKIRALAEAAGFRLESEGAFRYRDENNTILFSLSNYEATPFLPANMRTLTTHGITFLFDVPRVANGEKVFDQMAHLARLFSSTLNGIIVDDNRVPLSDNGIRRSKQQLINIQSMMTTHNIPAGSETALKLFV